MGTELISSHLRAQMEKFADCGCVRGRPRVQVNLYLTPPNAQAFEPHFDWMDGFILQIHGNKHWDVFDTAVMQPRPDMRFKPSTSDMQALGEPLAELHLTAGDVLYIPAGYVHAAQTKQVQGSPGSSLHLTFGMEVGTHYSWEMLLHHIVDAGLALADCSDIGILQHTHWGLRCVDGKQVLDIRHSCTNNELAKDCHQPCSVPLRHLLHQAISYLATQPQAWEIRRVVPITNTMRHLGCGAMGYHHCILRTLTVSGRCMRMSSLVACLSFNALCCLSCLQWLHSITWTHW